MSTANISGQRVTQTHMDYRAICRWLRLPDATWPPDHYTLLGLPRGESDLDEIESQAQERMAIVRCYQLSHPELATEALNRLAEAYACLTSLQTKRRYDAELGLDPDKTCIPVAAATKQQPRRNQGDTLPAGVQAIAYDPNQPPPTRDQRVTRGEIDTQEIPTVPATPQPVAAEPVEATKTVEKSDQVLLAEPADSVLASARESRAARRGIATRRGLYFRILLTRKLLHHWQRVGSVLGDANRKVTRPSEGHSLLKALWALENSLEEFPSFVGRAGKPGYRVAILARDEKPLKALHRMDNNERDLLEKDWRTGLTLIQSHLGYLREQIANRKQEGWVKDSIRAIVDWTGEHRALVTVAASVAVFTSVLILTWILRL